MIPVVISGGSGTRLWPISRAYFPKQFCHLLEQSLQEKTYRRVLSFGVPWTVTTRDLQVLTERTLQDVGQSTDRVLYEPMGRNTAAAIALVCYVLGQKKCSEEIVGVFPADHLIQDQSELQRAVALAEDCARRGQVVTLGIRPTYPATGYGYIQIAAETFAQGDGLKANHVKGFHEKPDLQTAEGYLGQGHYLWNAGMFVFRVGTVIEHLQKLAPKLWANIEKLDDQLSNIDAVYRAIESMSFDCAVMEKLTSAQQVCVPVDLGWTDLGSWEEMAKVVPGGDAQKSTFADSSDHNCAVFSQGPRGKVFALAGVRDLVIVDTPDALLVAEKGQSQKVKDLLGAMAAAGLEQVKQHLFEHRPWGEFHVLEDGSEFKLKRIVVHPGAQLSYQSHEHRAEHWVVVKGVGEVVLEDKVHGLKAGEHILIPQKAKHRMRNPGREPLEFIEVQTGSYFGEDDIIRYQDDYQRT